MCVLPSAASPLKMQSESKIDAQYGPNRRSLCQNAMRRPVFEEPMRPKPSSVGNVAGQLRASFARAKVCILRTLPSLSVGPKSDPSG
jgi:hypothetical protein